MKQKMSRKEELGGLKIKAREIQIRLDSLKMWIGEIQQWPPATSQWKAFVDAKKCVICGICEETCPVRAITIEECARVDAQRYIGCGSCVQKCPKGALSLRPTRYLAQYQTRSWGRANRPSRRINELKYLFVEKEENMCLSTVYINSGNEEKEIMKDVARIEAEGKGFWLINLFGEREFIEGSIQTVDLMDEHFVMLRKGKSNWFSSDNTAHRRQDFSETSHCWITIIEASIICVFLLLIAAI